MSCLLQWYMIPEFSITAIQYSFVLISCVSHCLCHRSHNTPSLSATAFNKTVSYKPWTRELTYREWEQKEKVETNFRNTNLNRQLWFVKETYATGMVGQCGWGGVLALLASSNNDGQSVTIWWCRPLSLKGFMYQTFCLQIAMAMQMVNREADQKNAWPGFLKPYSLLGMLFKSLVFQGGWVSVTST